MVLQVLPSYENCFLIHHCNDKFQILMVNKIKQCLSNIQTLVGFLVMF